MMKRLKQCWHSLNIALSMYSRLPAAKCEWTNENRRYVMCFFPLIGIVIGALCMGWDALAVYLNTRAAIRNAVMIVIPFAVTGGIHLDGFLDTSDATGSWKTEQERLDIMRDPHIGASAVISAILYFILLYGVVDSVSGEMMLVYACGFVISRSLSAISVVTFPKATATGTLRDFADCADTRATQVVCTCYIVISSVLMGFFLPIYTLAALLGAALAFTWYYRSAMARFGGITGDVAGYFVTICELAMPLMMVAVSFLR